MYRQNNKKECPICGELIVGRADKKYCSDYCRNLYNNKTNSNINNLMRNINNILRKNRRILYEFTFNKVEVISRKNLIESGFNFYYYTHNEISDEGIVHFYCYDFGYIPNENEDYKIVTYKSA